jgi:predicted PurR-regulated permease PerM
MATTKRTPPKQSLTLVDDSTDSVARRTVVVLSVTLAFVATVGFLYQMRAVLGLVFVSLIFALALAPMVEWLVSKRLRRGVAAGLAVFTLLLISFGVIGAATTPIVSQSDELAHNIPRIVDDITQTGPFKELDERYQLGDKVRSESSNLPQLIVGKNPTLVSTAQQTFSAIFAIVVVVTLTFFMLLEGPSAWRHLLDLLKRRDARRVDRTGKQILDAIGGFVWGNLIISLISGATAFILLSVFGVPYALPIAIAVGVLDLIPFVGAVIATVILVLMALTVSSGAALGVFIFFLIYQVIESNLVVPLIYARTVKLSPLVILVATIIGATLAGLVGVLLSIPAAAAIQIIIVELFQGARRPTPETT